MNTWTALFSSHLWHQWPSNLRTCNPCWSVGLIYHVSCVLIMLHPYPRCWLKLALTYIFRCLSDQPCFILINCLAWVQHCCRHSNTSGHQVAETIMSYDADNAWYITHVPMLPASPKYHLGQPTSRGDLCFVHLFWGFCSEPRQIELLLENAESAGECP